jgi:hypothetical protein
MVPGLVSCASVTLLLGLPSAFIDLSARFEPAARRGADAAVIVTLVPLQPAIVVNETPAPRLALDPDQPVLVDRQHPKKAARPPADAGQSHYLDPKVPVRFPVALAPGAPMGTHSVRGVVTYFFCSKSEGWCRKGKAEVTFEVTVP